jgi:hypothetical protein
MFDRLVERFCEFDDFCKKIRAEWAAYLVADGHAPERKHGYIVLKRRFSQLPLVEMSDRPACSAAPHVWSDRQGQRLWTSGFCISSQR